MNVRVRGIYATALTAAFGDAGHDVVDASAPIRERFAAESLPDARGPAPVDASVRTTDDRQGVGVHGDGEAVATLTDRLREVGIDALAWLDPAPRGAVFDGEVTETLGGGAVVRLADGPDAVRARLSGTDDTASDGAWPVAASASSDLAVGGRGAVEGYLPYGETADRITVGDALRVQVREPAPPWDDRRPELGVDLRVPGPLASLVPGEGTRVDAREEAAGRELAGMADLLGLEPPDGWGIRWHRPAVDAGMDALEAGLSRAIDRLDAVAAVREADVSAPRPLAAPVVGAWVWFGRESRFALDDRRRAVTTTMPGHHRVKAGSDGASAGVDFVEAFCSPETLASGPVSDGDSGAAETDGDEDTGEDEDTGGDDVDFPFGVVTETFGPLVGDRVRIAHGKPAGHLVVLGDGEVTDRDADAGQITVERAMTAGGTYDALEVPRESGDVATTTFTEGRWWYPTTYRDDAGDLKGTYLNVCTPVEVFPETVRYVDLHVDVIKHADGTVERVDDDELDAAVAAGTVPEPLAERARSVAASIENAL
ncbi:DUF402 domain-containing protein [Halopenitus persicus]|uniref:Probable ribonuclease FAU-1 n=1 Tax=Halopenitus persicus TaxID=1048396 RepID=A0A1H3FF87_9EURY|nr:DUF402 domain-containing protein [Halopenitus persicus]SDX89427.1 RNA-binding protein AU-1 [Halopenitus persicus]